MGAFQKHFSPGRRVQHALSDVIKHWPSTSPKARINVEHLPKVVDSILAGSTPPMGKKTSYVTLLHSHWHDGCLGARQDASCRATSILPSYRRLLNFLIDHVSRSIISLCSITADKLFHVAFYSHECIVVTLPPRRPRRINLGDIIWVISSVRHLSDAI